MKKILKYALLLIAFGFLGFNSIYFERLSEVRARADKDFDFEAFADSLYYQGMLPNQDQLELSELLAAIRVNANDAFDRHGNRLGIGNSAYFMVQCGGEITELGPDAILLSSPEAGTVSINTRYIFGNALRDASGLVSLTDFKTNAEFNRVSEALNTLIRTKVIPPVVEPLAVGDSVEVTGAIKLSKKHLDDPSLVITPAMIKLQ